jgi:hypothetical protein
LVAQCRRRVRAEHLDGTGKYRRAQHLVKHARVRLFAQGAHALCRLAVAGGPQQLVRPAQRRLRHLERARPAPGEVTPVQAEHIDGRGAAQRQRAVLPGAQDQPQVVHRVVRGRVDEQRHASRVAREEVSLLVAVAEAAGEQVVGPVERPGREFLDRLEVVDVGAEAVRAVHAPLHAWCHLVEVTAQAGLFGTR